MMSIIRRLVLPIGAAVVLGGSGFAFMASNSVEASHAGVGDNVVSGYNVRDVHYAIVDNPLTTGGTYIQQVSFTLSPDNATDVEAWFTDDSGNFVSGFYADCTEAGGTWTCQNPNVINSHQWAPTVEATHLHVSAAQ